VRAIVPPKHQNETVRLPPLGFSFREFLAANETLVPDSASVRANVWSGTDISPDSLIQGSATVTGDIVTQLVTGGVSGTIYNLTCTVSTSLAQVLSLSCFLAVIPDEESQVDSIVIYSSNVVGTRTNDNAPPGFIGEYMQTQASWAPATNVVTAVTSLQLSPGDWDVEGIGMFLPAAITGVGYAAAGVSGNPTEFGADGSWSALSWADQTVIGPVTVSVPTPVVRFSLANSTKIYLVTEVFFGISTLQVSGVIRARRMR
jgi:hypothetical protein